MLLQLLGCNSKVGLWGACRLVNVLALFELALPRARETHAALVEARHCMLCEVRLLRVLPMLAFGLGWCYVDGFCRDAFPGVWWASTQKVHQANPSTSQSCDIGVRETYKALMEARHCMLLEVKLLPAATEQVVLQGIVVA